MKEIIQKIDKHFIRSMILLTIGAIFSAFSIEEFLLPNHLFDGGITGISMIISHFIKIKLGLLIILINIPFMLLGFKKMNHIFVLKMIYAIGIMSLMTGFMQPMHEATDETILAVVYGGLILGLGVGLVLKGGGCLDGTEVVAVVLSKTTSLSVGQVILFFNIFIFLTAGFLFDLDKGLYSLMMYFISSKVIDIIDIGFESTKSVMIITDEGDRLADKIYKELGRTVTFIPGEGYISGNVKNILYCVITRAEIHDLKEIVDEYSDSAFMTISDVSEIFGKHIKANNNKKNRR